MLDLWTSLVTVGSAAEVPANAEQLSSVSAALFSADQLERVHFIAWCPDIGDSIR